MTMHYFNTTVAAEIGVNAAVIFQNFAYWIDFNSKQGRNFHDETYWMFSTSKEIAEQFEYLSEKQCRTAIDKLIDTGYIKTGNYNRTAYDRTRWFALTEKGESVLQTEEKQMPKKANGEGKKVIAIPDSKTKYKIKNIDPDRIARIRNLCGIS